MTFPDSEGDYIQTPKERSEMLLSDLLANRYYKDILLHRKGWMTIMGPTFLHGSGNVYEITGQWTDKEIFLDGHNYLTDFQNVILVTTWDHDKQDFYICYLFIK